MALGMSTRQVSLWQMIRRQPSGLGSRKALRFLSVLQDSPRDGCRKVDIKDLLIVGGSTLPLPTTFRAVSGRKTSIMRMDTPERMARNQKIHGQPALSANTPPRTGPMLGAVFGLGCSKS